MCWATSYGDAAGMFPNRLRRADRGLDVATRHEHAARRGGAVDRIRGQDHGGAGISRHLIRGEADLARIDETRVVGAVPAAMTACPADEVGRGGDIADCRIGHRALRGFRRGDPWFVVDAPDPKMLDGELCPTVRQADLGRLTGEA